MSAIDQQPDEPRVELRPCPPERRYSLPEWEVRVDGELAGWVHELHLAGAKATFFSAHGRHPATGKMFDLNLSTDRQERVDTVVSFHLHPEEAKGHEVSGRR